jgi:hypothetical protein
MSERIGFIELRIDSRGLAVVNKVMNRMVLSKYS